MQRDKGLRRLYEDGNARAIPSAMADKLRKLLLALETAETLEQLGRFPGWKLHPLKGDLKGLWSLTITGNWRPIFRYERKNEYRQRYRLDRLSLRRSKCP